MPDRASTAPDASTPERGQGVVLSAIGRAGLLGITSKQLALTTGRPLEELKGRLARLHGEGAIDRVGKGLWVLPRFAVEPGETAKFRGPSWYDERFSGETGVVVGRWEGEIQFNPNDELPVHRWWPYVQGFSAEFVRRTCEQEGAGRGSVVLDPFAGSGTVTVEARRLGARAIGVELMPIAATVARAKHRWDADPRTLRRLASRVRRGGKEGPRDPLPFLRETSRQFPPSVLRVLLGMKHAVRGLDDGAEKELLSLAFASILVGSSYLKRSPCLGYTDKKGLTASTPLDLFGEAVERIAVDLQFLRAHRSEFGPAAEILQQRSQELVLDPGSVDLAITSPPYVNGMDYVMNYKLEMAWLDQVASYEDLSRLKSSMVACDNVAPSTVSGHRAGRAVQEDPWLAECLERMRGNIRAKEVYRRPDMPEIVAKYFDDLVPVMRAVHRALRPGGKFVVVNGDSLMAGAYVPGDLLFARLAHGVGFEVERFEVARSRRSGQRRDFRLRESVLTLRKSGHGVHVREK